ncbi:MAG: zinc-ribbon domain-containing protein, partial [Polyangiaceae bacterium]|nr:zinc-ribbon domain-containing protein [Polyangiaceae bacterium]
MKVLCHACGASFLAPDEKIRGRVIKYRCRKCNTVLTADGTGLGPPSASTPPPASLSTLPPIPFPTSPPPPLAAKPSALSQDASLDL